MIAFLLIACAPEEKPAFTLLEPREQLIRLSVDLRGVHPTEAELVAIEDNPDLYDDFVDRYLEDERFFERLREVWNLRFLTRNGDSYFDPSEAGLSVDEGAVADALADEPLRLVSYIAENDLPWTEIVLAEHSMANPIVAAMWDMEGPEAGWGPATYRDGRPHAGILTMTTTWQRYPSMGGNANRHRANAIARLLLCDDYLTRPIALDRAAVDQLTEDPENAISSNTACQSCHSTLDPLAAHLFGFFFDDEVDGLRDSTTYRPENEEAWRDHAGKEPGYYGTPTANLRELAVAITEDPRFVDCAVETMWEGLTQRTYEDADWTEVSLHRAIFEAEGLELRPLARSIVRSVPYRAAAAADPALEARLTTVKTASPAQLAAIIEDITGYRWRFGGRDGLTTHDLGLPMLAGGVDGAYATVPAYDPGVGLVFIQERLAQAAAYHVAVHDLDPERTGEAILLRYVTAEDDPESAAGAFDQQIRYLYLRITGLPLGEDAGEPAELVTLWKQLYSIEASPVTAWSGVVSAVLRDPRVVLY